MFTRYLNTFFILFLLIGFLPGCTNAKKSNENGKAVYNEKAKSSSSGYDLKNPLIIRLSDELQEISGNAFYAKDTSVFAISDGNGYLFKIHLTTKNPLVEKWKFSKTHDFEDIVLHDSTFYVLQSNGDIYTVKFSRNGDSLVVDKSNFDGGGKKNNEFETLYYDGDRQQLVMICKECKEDKKQNTVTAFGFDTKTGTYIPGIFQIDVKEIEKITGENDMKFKPSAAAINPGTNDVWVLSSINKMIVVIDKKGVVKDVYPLDPGIMRQPEGITFAPWGDLIISSEAGDKYGKGSLFIFKKLTNHK
ncbi:MAG: SdiA-regulated domain-containing protein [Ginsengibacter sp.]